MICQKNRRHTEVTMVMDVSSQNCEMCTTSLMVMLGNSVGGPMGVISHTHTHIHGLPIPTAVGVGVMWVWVNPWVHKGIKPSMYLFDSSDSCFQSINEYT